ncbi:MAG: hypothetical protein JXA79_07785 [Deltaproteobacteria bacterium]|nr:hypothetical protein [Deltaproteobacteria bacterium]
MPLIILQISVPVSDEKRDVLLSSMSKIIAESIGKPEQYVMASIEVGSIMMSGKQGAAAFADVRSIGGLNGSVNKQISQKLCSLLDESLGISAGKVYINFTDVSGVNWGWNGSTFG